MLTIGLIKEEKIPSDNRVALTPAHCKWLLTKVGGCRIVIEPSESRCFADEDYERAGAIISNNLSVCDVLLGIKEVPVAKLIPNKTYLFFSHTKKGQPHNQQLMHAMIDKGITLVDYECLEHEDGQRIIGFGFFAGVVGAHNGMMAYGNRTKTFSLGRVYQNKDYRHLINTYFGLKLPNIKITVTGSGRVAHGILEIMNLMDVQEVEPEEYLQRSFNYPVYVHLKGADLYIHKNKRTYQRAEFHANPEEYECLFEPYCAHTDILMNGIYWDKRIPRLFEPETMQNSDFNIQTIADITDDTGGSIPCNLGDATITNPVYGVDKMTNTKTAPYLPTSVDVVAVGNLPNELPCDASRYFGDQLIKYVLEDILKKESSSMIERATILRNGYLTERFGYLKDYAAH
ncbi:alanine dehydrogenase [Ilyomonas limi]|uniref:Alanine dehydrogenase n=1 Tax=Ilyomonas limi TaxID=2575867 RepID=A0A4V5UU77_9BACT|nr:NAD(P)-dependent oxidoreductase [Ilyomonas limi]TKK66383.1 alanine dehydrogenase [Ilyomonas limi]